MARESRRSRARRWGKGSRREAHQGNTVNANGEKKRVDRDENEDEVLDEHADGGIENQGREK